MEEEGESRVYDYRCTKGGRGEDKELGGTRREGIKSATGGCKIRRWREKEIVCLPNLQLSWLDLNSGHMGPKSSKTGSHEPYLKLGKKVLWSPLTVIFIQCCCHRLNDFLHELDGVHVIGFALQ